MTYRSARTQERKKHLRIAALIGFVALIVAAWSSVQSMLTVVASPLLSAYVAVRDTGEGVPHTIVTFFTSRNAYEKRISELEAQIEQLENEVAYNTAVEALSEDAEVPATTTDKLATNPTQVLYPLLKDLTRMYDSVTLSAGFDDGLEEGMIVYVRGYEAVGYIEKVHKSTSIMKLFSSSDQTVEGVIKDVNMSVTLQGQGGGSYMIEAPKSVDLVEGQVIALASNHAMKLGTVVSVEDDPQSTFNKAYVRGAYNPTKAHTFYVDHR